MSANLPVYPVHTEHILFECWIGKDSAMAVRLFRAPIVLDGSGSHERCPHEIGWDDLRVGDLIVALQIEETPQGACFIPVLQLWHVLEKTEGEVRARVNNIAGSGVDGEHVYDRLAGLVGMPPSDRGGRPSAA